MTKVYKNTLWNTTAVKTEWRRLINEDSSNRNLDNDGSVIKLLLLILESEATEVYG